MTDDIQKDILKLTEEWHELVCEGIHKDRDCHWYIESVWSYGLSPKYFAECLYQPKVGETSDYILMTKSWVKFDLNKLFGIKLQYTTS